jgi:thiamine pyrophosphate-dependent acetolactate synthase large subunit-like protein
VSELTVREALAAVYASQPDETCYVVANGYISRDAFNLDDRPQNFYMLGSMGLGSAIAFGAALSQPERRLMVLDGDGNLLMGLGGLTVIGAYAPSNLYHVCLDNGAYASTGNQPTISEKVCLEGIAREAGYGWSKKVDTADDLKAALTEMTSQPGPAFLRVMVRTQEHPRTGTFDRVSHTCPEIHARFAASLRTP